MVDTNALLNIAFSLIANFTNVVPVPSDAVPQSPADLMKYVVETPSFPTDVYLVDRKGTEFWINGGVVYSYRSPGSFFQLQDPHLISTYEGTSKMDSNEVIRVAASVLQRLIKTKDPLLNESNGAPTIVYPSLRLGSQIPFFKVLWPKITRGPGRSGAEVEIDGRTGTIVAIDLWDLAFRDPVVAKRIKDQIYTPPPKPAATEELSPVRKFHRPQPTRNQVSEVISNWIIFCGKLGVDPGTQTNIADVNWDRTWLYTNNDLSITVPVCQVRFKNNACFESIGGTVFGHFTPNACYVGAYTMRPREQWRQYTGKIVKHQEDLVKNLETALVERLGIPASVLAQFSASPPHKLKEIEDDAGIMTINRALVNWRNWPHNAGRTVWVSETKLGLSAEFNLENGAVEFITFCDLQFIEILNHGPLKAK